LLLYNVLCLSIFFPVHSILFYCAAAFFVAALSARCRVILLPTTKGFRP